MISDLSDVFSTVRLAWVEESAIKGPELCTFRFCQLIRAPGFPSVGTTLGGPRGVARTLESGRPSSVAPS